MPVGGHVFAGGGAERGHAAHGLQSTQLNMFSLCPPSGKGSGRLWKGSLPNSQEFLGVLQTPILGLNVDILSHRRRHQDSQKFLGVLQAPTPIAVRILDSLLIFVIH